MNCSVNYGLLVIMMCHRRFLLGKKKQGRGSILGVMLIMGEVMPRNSVASSQFFS